MGPRNSWRLGALALIAGLMVAGFGILLGAGPAGAALAGAGAVAVFILLPLLFWLGAKLTEWRILARYHRAWWQRRW